MMMLLHVFLSLFFIGGVFGELSQLYGNNAVSTPQRIFNSLYNFQSKSSLEKGLFDQEDPENITSTDMSDMDNRSKLKQLDEVLYIMSIKMLKTICIDEILEKSHLLNEKYYWIQDIVCYVSNILMNNAILN
ncbi:uncharacterized protein LOC126849369 isoform X1 [Cataglyphis hispanica]|uniref:uncharacterized protein LOC126849369 isoform X1 n=1 Tax=Cataglyphis hispanica TaxID=1086592 RepID=UPI00217F27DB|nr:uncharacterized protein LOC126849369 isoform X1 [Cataglyphis hispanica]XP_050447104.1 uncharacterized protein LOC126849369 isoform X1 [Cataglyphis hispanica]